MSIESLISSPSAHTVLTELHLRFSEARTSLLRIRSERMRLARTGWRPMAPTETKLIRSAEWTVDRKVTGATEIFRADKEFDLFGCFVPTVAEFIRFSDNLVAMTSGPKPALAVRIRGLELLDPRFPIQGRACISSFLDLITTLSRTSDALITLPQVESYLEARFWAEVLRAIEVGLQIPKHTLRVEVGIDSLCGVAEAEEILFELKEFIESARFDSRVFLLDHLKLDSSSPSIPGSDFRSNPAGIPLVADPFARVAAVCEKRGVRLKSWRSKNGETLENAPISPLTLDALHEQVKFAFTFLREWFSGNPSFGGATWEDLDLTRGSIWTAIHSGFLREENYEAWKEGFGTQPFETGSAEDAALRTLDPLLKTALFPEYSMQTVLTTLIELEKTRSVNTLRLA